MDTESKISGGRLRSRELLIMVQRQTYATRPRAQTLHPTVEREKRKPNSERLTPIQPLHNPDQAAHQAPLGNVANQAGLGAKALLAKKMAKGHNPSFVSPTDKMMTPVSQKLAAAKKKQFSKAKPVQLFAQEEEDSENTDKSSEAKMVDDLPF
ncbi:hypothetical protein DL96DRAFT_1594401 [Flagelloscypha sp. PMI_526]|nr:hypothetical protein DL96DRAFT_1594401 [Flagelloscypha sp. PMI_526]